MRYFLFWVKISELNDQIINNWMSRCSFELRDFASDFLRHANASQNPLIQSLNASVSHSYCFSCCTHRRNAYVYRPWRILFEIPFCIHGYSREQTCVWTKEVCVQALQEHYLYSFILSTIPVSNSPQNQTFHETQLYIFISSTDVIFWSIISYLISLEKKQNSIY